MRFVSLPDPGRPYDTLPSSGFIAVFDQFTDDEIDLVGSDFLNEFGEATGAKATLVFHGTVEVA